MEKTWNRKIKRSGTRGEYKKERERGCRAEERQSEMKGGESREKGRVERKLVFGGDGNGEQTIRDRTEKEMIERERTI